MKDALLCWQQDLCCAFEGSAGSCLVGAHGKDEGGVFRCPWQDIIQPAAKPWDLTVQTIIETEAAR